MATRGSRPECSDSPTDQPARIAFVRDLELQYGDLAGFNRAWKTEAPSWDALRAPWKGRTEACNRDLDAFLPVLAEVFRNGVEGA